MTRGKVFRPDLALVPKLCEGSLIAHAFAGQGEMLMGIHALSARTIDGVEQSLATYAGKTLLVTIMMGEHITGMKGYEAYGETAKVMREAGAEA